MVDNPKKAVVTRRGFLSGLSVEKTSTVYKPRHKGAREGLYCMLM